MTNKTRVTRRCQAKDPSNCRYHGTGTFSSIQTAPAGSSVKPKKKVSSKAVVERTPEEVRANVMASARRVSSRADAGFLDYDYDDTRCSSEYCEGICRDRVYVGLHIPDQEIDARRAASYLLNISYEGSKSGDLFSPEFLEELEELGITDTGSYLAYGDMGYYGEEANTAVDNIELVSRLNEWFYAQPDAKDEEGVLDYVRSKGTDTSGLRPVEALKKQLTEENNGRIISKVAQARVAYSSRLNLSSITIPNQTHYGRVKPREMDPKNDSVKVAGIVVKNGDRYTLVDGYHRTKGLFENKKRAANFIVLDTSIPYGRSHLLY